MDGDRDTGVNIPDFHGSDLQGAARVGAELRGVRERLGWKLTDLAARLKIRRPFLEAIEAGDLAALPAPAYAAGFIRSYAEAMGLDPEEILRRFRAEGMSRERQPKLTFPEPVPDRAVPPGAIVFIAVVIAIGAYFLWYRHSEHELRMARMVPPVPAKLAPLAVPAAPPASVKPASVKPASAKPTPAQNVAVAGTAPVAPAATPANTTTVTPASPATAAASNGQAAAPSSATAAPSGTTAPGTTPAVVAATNPLVISAIADSWVQVRGTGGTILFSRILKAGQSWPVPDEPGLTLTTGNAGGTVLIRNGVTGTPLGVAGAVLRNVPLTKAPASSTGTVASPAAAPPSPSLSSPAAAASN
ncbi:MAG TPA: RodZ domain-containing protein [Acidiphilium sp.]